MDRGRALDGLFVRSMSLLPLSLLTCADLSMGGRAESACDGACDPLCVEVGRYRVTRETVVDRDHPGRVWQRVVSERLPHAEAARYCADMTLDGQRGFRLPAPAELGSLRYKAGGLFGGHRHYCIPSIDQAAFPETPAAEFWTSKVAGDGTAWYMGFDDGRMHRDVVTDPLWVRCVRAASPD